MKHFALVSAIGTDVGARLEESGGEQRIGEQSRGEERRTHWIKQEQRKAEESESIP